MLTKFETKVKGLAFHPKRPWILSSLYSGSIQLWDYKLGILIDKYDEHEGPVRGLAFHYSQPLFVSGGDDYKIKLWNVKTGKCLFTLKGHLDFIRTVFFHHEHPWIISCGDDQTIRIWNWQSRTCISVLTGHSHYVMSAVFHPSNDLILSASLDQTLRVWDISGLRKKHSAGKQVIEDRFNNNNNSSSSGPGGQADVFGNMDCVVKYVLEGHSRGINWASFHPTLPLIVSCGDDRLIKIWRMSETKAWEVDTCRGHFNNCSAVFFQPRQDIVLSVSEDKTLRVWDAGKRTCLQTFRRDEKFWALALHPHLNLYAAGHDNGLVVFKLERERPAYTVLGSSLYFVRGSTIYTHSFSNQVESVVIAIKRGSLGQDLYPRNLSISSNFTPTSTSAQNQRYLVSLGKDVGVYQQYLSGRQKLQEDPIKESGFSAQFISSDRIALIELKKLIIKDLKNVIVAQPLIKTKDGVEMKIVDFFPLDGGLLLITSKTHVVLYDFQKDIFVAEVLVSDIRYVSLSSDKSLIALYSPHSLLIINSKMERLCYITEVVKMKSGVWLDSSQVFIYSTLGHIKYCLINGDNGIIRSIEQPIYIVKAQNNILHYLNRQSNVVVVQFDPTEYRFKLALLNRNFDEVFKIIRTSNLMGQAIIGYLQKKGYPDIALQFVKDPKTRFDLALESGNIEVALEMAKTIDQRQYWDKLVIEALRQGNQSVVEFVYQKTKNFDKLSFLYLITGDTNKLKKMLRIADSRQDAMSRLQTSLYLGDVRDQVKNLSDACQCTIVLLVPLAYLTAQTYGLKEEAANILKSAGLDHAPKCPSNSVLTRALLPVVRRPANWPLLKLSDNFINDSVNRNIDTGIYLISEIDKSGAEQYIPDSDVQPPLPYVPEYEIEVESDIEERFKSEVEKDEASGWDNDDLDIIDVPFDYKNSDQVRLNILQSKNVSAHIALGSFDTALEILEDRFGGIEFQVLEPYFMSIYQAAQHIDPAPPADSSLFRSCNLDIAYPIMTFDLGSLDLQLQAAYILMTSGKFTDAAVAFRKILHQSILTELTGNVEIEKIVTASREYLVGLGAEVARKDLGTSDPKRAVELAAYFTHCHLQPGHSIFALKAAMVLAFKLRNFGTAMGFAKRLLLQNPPTQFVDIAKKISSHCERNSGDEFKLNYEPDKSFVICAASYEPIYDITESVKCLFCTASYRCEYDGDVCNICSICRVGETGTGFYYVQSVIS